MSQYQVIIVGGGPVGVALGVELGQRGISCALVERHTTPQRIPKGQNLTQRTMEHFHFWGIADRLRSVRLLPDGYPIGGVTVYGSGSCPPEPYASRGECSTPGPTSFCSRVRCAAGTRCCESRRACQPAGVLCPASP